MFDFTDDDHNDDLSKSHLGGHLSHGRGSSSPQSAPATLLEKPSYADSDNHTNLFSKQTNLLIVGQTTSSSPMAETPPLQVVELTNCKQPDEEEESRHFSNYHVQQPQSPEPIVELKQTSSSCSSSGSSTPKSTGGGSPISSRQSSDHEQHRQHLTSSSSSSSRLIRRRTVRRSYHHREEIDGQHDETEQKSQVVVKCDKKDDDKQQQLGANESELTFGGLKSHFRTRQIGTSNYGNAKQQQHQSTLSTSSSKIAKSLSSSVTQTNSSSSSSRQDKSTSHKVHQISSSSLSSVASSSEQTIKDKNEDMASSSLEVHSAGRGFSIERERPRDNTNNSGIIEEQSSRRSFELEQEEESRVHHRESSFNSSQRATTAAAATTTTCSTTASTRSECSTASLSRHLQRRDEAGHRFETSTSSSSASLFVSSKKEQQQQLTAANQLQREPTFLSVSDNLFTSPDVRSLVKDIGTDFAELENALVNSSGLLASSSSSSSTATSAFSSSNHQLQANRSGVGITSSLSSRLFGSPLSTRRQLSPLRQSVHSILPAESSQTNNNLHAVEEPVVESTRKVSTSSSSSVPLSVNGLKIRELIDRAKQSNRSEPSESPRRFGFTSTPSQPAILEPGEPMEKRPVVQTSRQPKPINDDQSRCKAVMNESIERIDQRMSELCKKLNECQSIDEAIDLLKIMIQMIEKAWSVPVCGDDLGFKLCNSLRHAGGLDVILGFINEAEQDQPDTSTAATDDEPVGEQLTDGVETNNANHQTQFNKNHQLRQIKQGKAPLKLSLSKLSKLSNNTNQTSNHSRQTNGNHSGSIKDNDSDIITSDLGLDSTSVESLAGVCSASGQPTSKEEQTCDEDQTLEERTTKTEDNQENIVDDDRQDEQKLSLAEQVKLQRLSKEELVFLSARLLSQCLTSENRDYIVKFDLDPVIKLACNYTTMKSVQSKRLLSRASLKLKQTSSSTDCNKDSHPASNKLEESGESQQQRPSSPAATTCELLNQPGDVVDNKQQNSDVHSAIGAEILQHLFKHSEETCSTMISLGGLQAILYGCRSANVETLRHCASALANLALYGGSDSQQMMIEQKAHVWLFPLAFNEDDNVQYYACLAIVALAANQEIEADVLKSSTLDLVEPFVTSHEPRRFAESTTSHIHGQSAIWLRKLIPILESKREEARNLACFHFAMEAYIKREQGQTQVFKEIGAIEPLRRAGSSPIAIASKFACQALRLIGEKEPHKLSQQVPLWTCQDVCEWIDQIGFERFKAAFKESHVDGDLLLQLDDEMLRFDIGIDNGIIRRRFLRELSNLKRIADYSSVDKSNLSSLLASTGGGQSGGAASSRDFIQYIYPILQLGVTRDNIHLLDCDQLLLECKITNAIHRMKLAQSIRELQDERQLMLEAAATGGQNSSSGPEQKTLDCFVSYRRSTGSQLASLLKVHLQLRGFTVFIDVERLEAGKFDNNLLDSIKTAKNFILVLSQNALDRCIGDHDCKDWVHKEIVAALSSSCNIIPIMDNFQWPEAEQLPEDMRSIPSFNSVRWIHDYQDACVDKLERFIRGDWPPIVGGPGGASNAGGGGQQTAGSIGSLSSLNINPNGATYCNSRLSGATSTTNVSTPSIVATPSVGNGPGRPDYASQLRTSSPFGAHPSQQQQPAPLPLPFQVPHPSESDSHPLSFVNSSNHHLMHLHNNSNNNNTPGKQRL